MSVGECCLTGRLDVQFVLKGGEHLQREGLTFLPDINEFFDFFLQDKKQSKWGVQRDRTCKANILSVAHQVSRSWESHDAEKLQRLQYSTFLGVPFDHQGQIE
jgi:hypothetical protein